MKALLGIGLVVLTAACGPAHVARVAAEVSGDGPLVLPRDLVGCYALYDANGHPASRSLYFAPPFVRLESTPWGDANRRWRLTKLDSAGQPVDEDRGMGARSWSATPRADTVRMLFHTGLSGSELIFATGGTRSDTLRGSALEHWDVGPTTTQAGGVTAIRTPCPSE